MKKLKRLFKSLLRLGRRNNIDIPTSTEVPITILSSAVEVPVVVPQAVASEPAAAESPVSDQWKHLYRIGSELLDKYEEDGNPVHLSEAFDNLQKAHNLRPSGDSDCGDTFGRLGTALLERYKQEGNLDGLTQAIACCQEDLTLCPPGHPRRAAALGDLANALFTRYEREGESADLVQTIQLYQQALDLCPPGHPLRSTSLMNLATALQARYEREGESADLVRAIQLYQQALDLCPPGHPGRSASLMNLANALCRRYEREGESADLVQAIQLYQQSLDLHPPGHPLRSKSLMNLATALQARYEREGESADLVQAIQLYQQSLDLHPPGHPLRSMSLTNLATALRTRHEREGESADLVQAIQLYQQSLDLRPPGHPLRPTSLMNLATALKMRYEREEESADLVQAIQLYQHSLDLHPPGHPLRSMSLRSLANILLLQYESLSSTGLPHSSVNTPSDLGLGATKSPELTSDDPHSLDSLKATIISLLREASQSKNSSPRDSLWAALQWITVSKDIDSDSTLDAYISALQQLDVVLAFGQSLDQRHNRLLSDDLVLQTKGLSGEAATWSLERGDFERAVELLEQGRTLLLAQVGRYRVELDDLRQVDSKLAGQFSDLSRRLDESIMSEKQVQEAGSTTGDTYGIYRNLSTKWDQTVDQIRLLPGFDTFLKPIPYDRLRKAATEGPIIIIVPNKNGSNALIVCDDSPPHHIHLPLATSDRLATLSNDFPECLDLVEGEGNRTEGLCLANLRILWNEVVGPIAQALQDLSIVPGSRIWWCPTSVTSFLPLHAAGTYVPGRPMENFPNLYISSYTPTIQSLVRARRHASATGLKKLLLVAQPDTPYEQPLHRATEEADVIGDIASGTREVTTLSGEAGTLEDVQHALQSHPWIHFICHGNQVPGRPLDSYLSLYDDHLKIRDIVAQNLPNADFAFLSACHSAAGDHDLADEALHLAGAMQFAGFRGVIGTLWRMWDDDGHQLAEAFYQEMALDWDSRRAAKALSQAIKVLRRNGVPMSHWIRFVHIGI